MCGLVAFADIDLIPGDPSQKMAAALKAIQHRGYTRMMREFEGSLFGHVRLPIQGLDANFDQPWFSDDYCMSFVGEIFNYKQLDPEAKSDVPVMADLIQTASSFRKIDGFFSVAYKLNYGNFTAAVDYLAQKPLYYHIRYGIVASELRAIEAILPDMLLDDVFLSNVLKWGYDPEGRTPYKHVKRVNPGHLLVWTSAQEFVQMPYMELVPKPGNLRGLIEEAVERRLVSDLPVASLCSGGLDSTIISLLAAKHSRDLTVFHVLNNEDDTAAFRAIKWPSHVMVKEIELVHKTWEAAIDATEEPVDLGSVHPQYELGKALALEDFHVVLTGDGADELFGGYKRSKIYDSQYSDIFNELVHYHLPRLDKTMMASTVELRAPFLAPYVIERALMLPYSERTEKQALKNAFKDLVPEHILNRPKMALKTSSVVDGGMEYRKRVIDHFLNKRGRYE